MEGKYYTPTIEEFCVGFEYEEYNKYSDEWDKDVWDVIFEQDTSKLYNFNLSNTRVQYLDQADIESLGLELVSDEYKKEMSHPNLSRGTLFRGVYSYGTMNSQIYVKPYHLGGQIDKVYIYMAHLGNGYHIKFEGTIKNKSELKKVLKMIGYE